MQTPLTIGVDVAKDTVMIAAAHQAFTPHSLPNERTALRSWLRGPTGWTPPLLHA